MHNTLRLAPHLARAARWQAVRTAAAEILCTAVVVVALLALKGTL